MIPQKIVEAVERSGKKKVIVRTENSERRVAVKILDSDLTMVVVQVVPRDEANKIRNRVCELLSEVVEEITTEDGRF